MLFWVADCLFLCQSEVTVLMFISRSAEDDITANAVKCHQSHGDFFIFLYFTPVRLFVQIKHRYDFSVSGQTARTRLWVIAAAEAFYVSQFTSQRKSTCFYKSSPQRNTCTEKQTHCFSLSYIVKDWKSGETTPGRFAESLILSGATRLTEEFLSDEWVMSD